MNQSQRAQEKKRRRQKRLSKREDAKRQVSGVVDSLLKAFGMPAPSSFPGACDPALACPDRIKFELGEFCQRPSNRDRMRQFERLGKQGVLGNFPAIDHWCMEEFLWHGAPDEPWNPVDQFLAASGDRFSPSARQQLARWKEARIGFYEIGDCADDLVNLRELDPISLEPVGSRMRAIALNIGGVNHYSKQKGLINLTYVAPWAPDQSIYCAMGYGISVPRGDAAVGVPLVYGMRNPKVLVFPMPWKAGKIAQQHFLAEWSRRDWHAWIKARIELPFLAAVKFGPGKAKIVRIEHFVTRSAEEARRMGVYFASETGPKECGVLGATALVPIDADSPNALVLAEYHEFRRLAGPPPAMRSR